MNENKFYKHIMDLSIRSTLYEISATPKPGLVDRNNSGSHNDMDFFSFTDSISVLGSYFYKSTKVGAEYRGSDYREILKEIRPIGIEAEKEMFNITGGVNTYKGIIFSMGILNSAIGSLYSKNKGEINGENIGLRVGEICWGITKELEEAKHKEKKTYGERLFLDYGYKGIRGEVESGFETIRKISLPVFKKLMESKKYHINDILVHTLIYLMANTEDSNILGRHEKKTLFYVIEQSKEALKLGGYLEEKGRDYIRNMDIDFIEKNISPGGSADLLGLTVMFYLVERGCKEWKNL